MLGGTLDRAGDQPGPPRGADRLGARAGAVRYFEISDGTIALEHERKLELIERLAQEFTVLSEVGSKDDTGAITPPYVWVEQMRAELAAGAWKVIAEGREAGTAGIFRPTARSARA